MEGLLARAERALSGVSSLLLVDWPSSDVPVALAGAGLEVFVKGGPDPGDFATYRLARHEVVRSALGHPPEHVDLVYSYRPPAELPSILELAAALGAGAVWCEFAADAGPDAAAEARRLVEAAGLEYVGDLPIGEVVRSIVRPA